MSRTVTGSYIIRPTSYNSYLSSGTFSNYFSTSPSAPSSWTTKMNISTQIGDNSDSTYYSDTGVSSSNSNAENVIMNMTKTSGTVPAHEYKITKVSLNYRAKASTTTDGSRNLNLWFSIWNSNEGTTPTAAINAGHFGMKTGYASSSSLATATTSIATKTFNITSLTNGSYIANRFPNRLALCARAWKSSYLVPFSYWYLYDVWFEISWSYEEDPVKTYIYTDDGVTISGDASIAPGTHVIGESYIEDYVGETKSLTASVSEGREFDGWYINGVLISEELTITITMTSNDQVYAISKIRKVYVGPAPVKEVYVGTTLVEVYSGDEKIFGASELYGNATAVG